MTNYTALNSLIQPAIHSLADACRMPWPEFSVQGHWPETWACGLGSASCSWHIPTAEEHSSGQARLPHRGSSGGSGIINHLTELSSCSCGKELFPVGGASSKASYHPLQTRVDKVGIVMKVMNIISCACCAMMHCSALAASPAASSQLS